MLPSTDAFAALLDAAGATTRRLAYRWQEVPPPDRSVAEMVVITVDNAPTRRDVQLDMPRLMLNAGNADTGLYRVTFHDFLRGACLRCISRGDQRSNGPDESAARRLGLRLADLRPHLDATEPLPDHLLDRATLTDAERARLRGLPAHRALGVVCGTFAPLPDVPALSMPALSAAPGVLLASELIKNRLGASTALDAARNVVATGIFSGPHGRWLSSRHKQPGCECGDPIYRDAYTSRWT